MISPRCFAHFHPPSDVTLVFKPIPLRQFNGLFAFMIGMMGVTVAVCWAERHSMASNQPKNRVEDIIKTGELEQLRIATERVIEVDMAVVSADELPIILNNLSNVRRVKWACFVCDVVE